MELHPAERRTRWIELAEISATCYPIPCPIASPGRFPAWPTGKPPNTMFSWWGGCEQITSLTKQSQKGQKTSNSRMISPTQLEQMFGGGFTYYASATLMNYGSTLITTEPPSTKSASSSLSEKRDGWVWGQRKA